MDPPQPTGIVVMLGSRPIGVVKSAELRRVYAQLQRMELEAESLGHQRQDQKHGEHQRQADDQSDRD
jgi:uncharacterized protein with von Willebrand factor type A (vWA) domain